MVNNSTSKMGFLFHTQFLFHPEPNFCLANIKLYLYNHSNIFVSGKCTLTLQHTKHHVDILFIVVELKCVPVLGLSATKRLNLIKLFCCKLPDQQLLSEFSYCFGEIGTLNRIQINRSWFNHNKVLNFNNWVPLL